MNRHRQFTYAGVLTGLLVLGAGMTTISAQGKTTKDGVYTEAQSERGAAAAKTGCAACHGRTMKGGMLGPSVVSDTFKGNYDGTPLADLFDKIQMTMPQNNPGTLTPEATADLVAFILKLNDFPAGETEIPTDPEALKQITFKQ
jgi:mono/diheme cytochrome c family protein